MEPGGCDVTHGIYTVEDRGVTLDLGKTIGRCKFFSLTWTP
jgi:hypothetical protein